jgi:hypothetical protein
MRERVAQELLRKDDMGWVTETLGAHSPLGRLPILVLATWASLGSNQLYISSYAIAPAASRYWPRSAAPLRVVLVTAFRNTFPSRPHEAGKGTGFGFGSELINALCRFSSNG